MLGDKNRMDTFPYVDDYARWGGGTDEGRNWKKPLMIVAAVVIVLGAAGYGFYAFMNNGTGLGTEADAYVCRPKEGSKNQGLELYLGEDGKTIEKVVFKDGTDEEMLSKYLERIGATDDSLDTEFSAQMENYAASYYTMMDGNQDLAWFDGDFSFNPEKHDVVMKGTVDLTNEMLEPEEENTWNFLGNMGITQFYNEKSGKFEFTKENRDAYLEILDGMAECVPVQNGE